MFKSKNPRRDRDLMAVCAVGSVAFAVFDYLVGLNVLVPFSLLCASACAIIGVVMHHQIPPIADKGSVDIGRRSVND